MIVRSRASGDDVVARLHQRAVDGLAAGRGTLRVYAGRLQTGGGRVGNCDNGTARDAQRIAVRRLVWGFDHYVSYAYPTGTTSAP